MADLGQEEDFEAAREKALKVGAKAFYLEVGTPCHLASVQLSDMKAFQTTGLEEGVHRAPHLPRRPGQRHLRSASRRGLRFAQADLVLCRACTSSEPRSLDRLSPEP